ncbi:protein inturned [Ornithorhynchus anatinus]|uniref:protein inturned n=1 Tax=Ornithorhynchus anatinus TaxID=9258 RepID=UPI0010A82A0D|nr:protein inturned [Ornithorhynchus anatinus]
MELELDGARPGGRADAGSPDDDDEEEEERAGESWDSGSGSSSAGTDEEEEEEDGPEPEWTSSVRGDGELFYVELSGGEAESPEASAAERLPSPGAAARGLGGAAGGGGGRPRGPLRRWARIFGPKSPPPTPGGAARPPGRDVHVVLDVGGPAGPGAALGLLEGLAGATLRPRGAGGPQGRGARLAVRGLLPGRPAGRSPQVLVGDVLVSVNDVDVDSENFERILSHLPRPTQVKLTFETPAPGPGEKIPEKERAARRPAAAGGGEARDGAVLLTAPHVVMYLALQPGSDAAGEEQEILYRYPDAEASQKLKSVRGIFLTLSDMLENVTRTPVTSSSLILSGKLVHVTYWKESGRLLIIALPDENASLPQLKNMMNAVVRTLQFMYGSLDSAFRPEGNAPSLDRLFRLFFRGAVLPAGAGPALLDHLPGAHWVPVPREAKVEIDTELSELEAADFGELSEDYYGTRRLYAITGSSLFYKGYLIGSHLPREDLVAVAGYCRLLGLLSLSASRRIGRLVVWREIFRPRRLPDAAAASPEPEPRRFLLAVGLDHLLLCVVLEAGGRGPGGTPGPDPVYVEQARASLRRLRRLAARGGDRPAAGPSSAPGPGGTPPKGGRKKPPLPNPFQPATQKKVPPEGETEFPGTTRISSDLLLSASPRLSSGPEDAVFHYVLLETARGVFVAPTSEDTAHLGSAVTPRLITAFSRCSLIIRSLFQESLRRQETRAGDAGPDAVREHGVLFDLGPADRRERRKPAPATSYWVVGRLLRHPEPQELYVCFHESVPEIAVELAFKLSFGLTL